MAPIRFFDHEPFQFETVRALWYAPAGGADYAEVLCAVRRIRGRSPQAWYAGWAELAQRLADRAATHRDALSRGNARLRASNYMRTAEFFLAPASPLRPPAAGFAQEQFFRGLADLEVPFERRSVPYDGVTMETIFLPGRPGGDLLLLHGGFDSTPEELFFALGRGAQARGYSVLIYEGPGQGQLLRRHGRALEPDWHRPLAAALDAALAAGHFARVVGVGVSLGGYLLARAAAREPRLDAIVLADYFPAPTTAFAHRLPRVLHGVLRARRPWLLRALTVAARFDAELAWTLAQGTWVFGARDLDALLERVAAFDEVDWVEQIGCDVLALVGDDERFFDPGLATGFARRLVRARRVTLRRFTRAEGGELHCRNGAYHLLHETVFDWLAEAPAQHDEPLHAQSLPALQRLH